MLDQLTSLGADEVAVEFGIVLGAETGLVMAKGTTEVHFTVGVIWRRGEVGGTKPGSGGGGD
jgi:hypothetical protein